MGENQGKIGGKVGKNRRRLGENLGKLGRNQEEMGEKLGKNREKIGENVRGNWGKIGEKTGKIRVNWGRIRGKSGKNLGKFLGEIGEELGETLGKNIEKNPPIPPWISPTKIPVSTWKFTFYQETGATIPNNSLHQPPNRAELTGKIRFFAISECPHFEILFFRGATSAGEGLGVAGEENQEDAFDVFRQRMIQMYRQKRASK